MDGLWLAVRFCQREAPVGLEGWKQSLALEWLGAASCTSSHSVSLFLFLAPRGESRSRAANPSFVPWIPPTHHILSSSQLPLRNPLYFRTLLIQVSKRILSANVPDTFVALTVEFSCIWENVFFR